MYKANIKGKNPIQLISTGSCHTILANSKGRLYSWGWNNYGQCGHPSETTSSSIMIPEIKRDKKGQIPNIPVINYLSSGKHINNELFSSVKQVVCAEDHSFIVQENGNAYAFGNNHIGQLGLGNDFLVKKPMLIVDLQKRVKEIKTAGDFNIALTTDNKLYIWSYNIDYGSSKNTFILGKPTKLSLDSRIAIQSVSCGKNFSIILSKQGILYSFGKNNKGELGLGDYEKRLSPEPVSALAESGEKIAQVSCGFKHVVAKSTSGKAFTWGNVKTYII